MAAPSPNSKTFSDGLVALIQQAAGLMAMPDADVGFLQFIVKAMADRARQPAGAHAAAGAPAGAAPGGPPGAAGGPPGGPPMGAPPASPMGGMAQGPAGVRPLYPMGNPDEIRRMAGAAQQ